MLRWESGAWEDGSASPPSPASSPACGHWDSRTRGSGKHLRLILSPQKPTKHKEMALV